MSMKDLNTKLIRELAELLAETGLTEIEVEQNGTKLRVARQSQTVYASAPAAAAPVAAAAAPQDATAKPSGPAAGAVPSPMVGTVYTSPEPGKPPFVKVGDSVKEGDTLLIVEAMKTMNPILSPRAGKITEICIRDAQPVEFGQSLMIIS
ncbi:MAG TPA: acetyl-CoA carboxylase biotin carboxyl carrier protein [Rhizomicrobium sp.]|jgi:acetyl-CoA carboxylase biotin carboxyl carrier protein